MVNETNTDIQITNAKSIPLSDADLEYYNTYANLAKELETSTEKEIKEFYSQVPREDAVREAVFKVFNALLETEYANSEFRFYRYK